MKLVSIGLVGAILAISAGVSGCSDDPPAAVKPAKAKTKAKAEAAPATDDIAADVPAEEGEEHVAAEEAPAPMAYAPYSPDTPSPAAQKPASTSNASTVSSSSDSDSDSWSSRSDDDEDSSTSSSTGSPVSSGSTVGGSALGSTLGSTIGSTVGGGSTATTPTTSAGTKVALLAKAQTFSTHLFLTGLKAQNRTGQDVAYDAYFPTNFKTGKTGSYVFVVHGGEWTEGAKEDVKPFAIALAEKGFVAIAPDYRLAPANPHPAQVNDLSDLMAYIEANPNTLFTTGTKYGAVGVAAGGHLASMVALSSSAKGNLDCVANVFSQTDLTNLVTIEESIKQFLGTNYSLEALAGVSPLHMIPNRAASPKFYLSHGTADSKVPYAQSEAFAAALKVNGLQVTLQPVPDGKHGYGEAQTKATAAEIATFMSTCLAIQ